MTGYTRKSIASIINGSNITAPPLNAEFDQLLAAFDASTGHSHDGTSAGAGPKINLATSVSGLLPAVNGGSGGANKLDATANPTIANDSSQNYAVGSVWINVSTDKIFICVDSTSNAAQWRQIVANDGLKIVPETPNTIDIGAVGVEYKDLHLAGNALVGGTIGVTGLSTLASVDINGGNIDGTTIGSTTAADGNFTNTSASGNSTISGTLEVTGTSTLDSVTVGGAGNHGSINGVVIGSTNPTSIAGTTVSASSGFSGDLTGNVTGNVTVPVDSNGNSLGTSTFNNVTINGTLTGNLTGGISGNVTATTGSSQFNDVTINGTLNMDAGTTGTIENLATPVNANDAATKGYVDTEVSNLVASAPAALDTLNELAAAINDDENFSTTITNSIAAKLPLGGGTMTGAIDMGSQKITTTYTPTNNADLTNKSYVDTQDDFKLSLSGGTMSGAIAMGNNKVTDLGTPTAATDAATKGYADGILGSSNAAATSATAAANSAAAALASENAAAGHASTAQSAIASSQQFLDTYFVSATAPSGSNLSIGDLWFDTFNNIMMVYGSGGFQNAGSSVNGTSSRADFVVGTSSGSYTGSTTTFPAVYDAGFVDVYLNGVKLAPSDFTASTGTNIVLGSAASTGDTVAIVGYGTFQLSSHYTKSETDALLDDVEALALAGL